MDRKACVCCGAPPLRLDNEPDDIHADAAPDLLVGAGTFGDPWRVSWPGASEGGPDLELWLEPSGPPSGTGI
jgi:hypothetical protein